MGMYDTINGEQVKCFPWAHYYEHEIVYSGGDLQYYENGTDVPYKKPYYNYSKNFLILDINEFPDSDYTDYNFVIHLILDGKVFDTYKDSVPKDIPFDKIANVISYRGTLLNLHSAEDILNYIEALRKYRIDYDILHEHWNELFKQVHKVMFGIGTLDKESKERKERLEKYKVLHKQMEAEKERIADDVDALLKTMEKWYVDTTEIDPLIDLGDFIYCYLFMCSEEHKANYTDEARLEVYNQIKLKLDNDEYLLEKYCVWQELPMTEDILKEVQI